MQASIYFSIADVVMQGYIYKVALCQSQVKQDVRG